MKPNTADKDLESVAGLFESMPCVRGFLRMCADGAAFGWHEANGGNASYRLMGSEAEEVRSQCAERRLEASVWEPSAVSVPALGGEMFLVSAAGSFMGRLAEAPAERLGIVEIDREGRSFRTLAGFCAGARPTSEFAGHLLIHEARFKADDASRVLYHAHPDAIIALSKLTEPSPRAFTRTLWKAMTECILAVPEGVGAVPCLVPGSLELARASAEQMGSFRAVVWAQHGLLCSGSGFDDAFGRMQSLVKAAQVHLAACAASGGADRFPNDIADEDLRAIDAALGLGVNEAFLTAESE